MGTRLTALDRAADRMLGEDDYGRTLALVNQARYELHRAAKGMNDDALYARTMVAATDIADIIAALRDAKVRNERENEAIRAILGNA